MSGLFPPGTLILNGYAQGVIFALLAPFGALLMGRSAILGALGSNSGWCSAVCRISADRPVDGIGGR